MNTSELFEFNKMLVVYFFTVSISTTWLATLIITRRKVAVHWYFLVILVFLASILISTIQSIDVHTSIFGYYGRFNGGLLSLASYTILAFIFYNTFNRSTLLKLLPVSFGTSCIVLLWGLLSYFGFDLTCQIFAGNGFVNCWSAQFNPQARMFSTLGQPNWLAMYLIVHFFIGIYFLLKNSPKLNRALFRSPKNIFLFVILLLFVLGVYATKSRSGMLAFAFSSVLFVSIYLRRVYRKYNESTLLIVFSIVVFVFANVSVVYRSQANLQNASITDSLTIRTIVWKGALSLANRYPILGTGPETFGYSYYFTRPIEHNDTSEWDFLYNKAHNEFIQYFATTGYVGGIAYLAFVFSGIVVLLTLLKNQVNGIEFMLPAILLSGLVSLHISHFYGFSITISQLFLYMIPAMGLTYTKKDEEVFNAHDTTLRQTMLLLLVFFVGLFGAVKVFQYYQADVSYSTGKRYFEEQNYIASVTAINTAMSYKYDHVYENSLALAYAYSALTADLQSDEDLTLRMLDLARFHSAHILAKSPKNILYWRTNSQVFFIAHQLTESDVDLKESLRSVNKVIELAPTDPRGFYNATILYQYAYSQTGFENYLKLANEYIAQGLQLKPDYTGLIELSQNSLLQENER